MTMTKQEKQKLAAGLQENLRRGLEDPDAAARETDQRLAETAKATAGWQSKAKSK